MAAVKFFRHGIARPEVDHVQTARCDHLGDAGFGGGLHARWARAQDTADQLVGPLGGGEIEDPINIAGRDQTFHGASARAGGVKDEDLVTFGFQQLPTLINQFGGVAKHRGGDQRLGAALGSCAFGHAHNRPGGVGKDAPANAVDPGHIDHRRHHHNITHPHIGGRVPGSQGADHEFGQADG